MLAFLQQQPYVFALTIALLTAALAYMYSRTTEKEPAGANKTFFKTLAAGALAGIGLTWLTSARPEALATEPFDALPVGAAAGGI